MKNEINLAFTIGYLRKEEDICYMAEQPEKICVLASPEHPLCNRKKLSAKDFAGDRSAGRDRERESEGSGLCL